MSVSEIAAPLCQRIHVRSDHFRMASEEADPVVQIVDCNEEDIGGTCRSIQLRLRCGGRDQREDTKEDKRRVKDCGSIVLHRYFFFLFAGFEYS